MLHMMLMVPQDPGSQGQPGYILLRRLEGPLLVACLMYTTVSEPWRNIGFCSSTLNQTDSNLKEGWYRFNGTAGDMLVSSCAQDATKDRLTNYNLFTCNSSINNFITCSEGFIVYYLVPTQKIYATRHSNCTKTSCGANAYCGAVYGSCVCDPGLILLTDNNNYSCSALLLAENCQKVEEYLKLVMSLTSAIESNSTDNNELISSGNRVLAVVEKLVSLMVTPTDTENITSIKLNNVGSAAVVFISYTNMASILKPSFFKTDFSKEILMMSPVVSAKLPNINSTSLTRPVNFTFTHDKMLVQKANLSCVYWNETVWIDDGCSVSVTNSTHTTCSCTHLSTFALLMMTNPEKWCQMLAGVIHFLFLSAFVWMFIEAVLLYICVKNLLSISSKQKEVLHWKCMIVIGYAAPLVVVGVTTGLHSDAYTDKKTLVFKTLLQFVILGCPWALGFLTDNTMVYKIFFFLNSQQGTFIFIIHCVFNQEIRRQYRTYWMALCKMAGNHSRASRSHSN
ncbi:Adhesion G protein-coupled receptor E1 [Bagarius yarrelli]|uniref:Adhesion G protein-coupled receptor E1 n=1 Tax=Bagarius yarrelli TaxID=175774 RepID=A0A556TLB7_BAGYA|nr:Adhesion G protein-coupled receptor E1 [Bagarius yarrelli]